MNDKNQNHNLADQNQIVQAFILLIKVSIFVDKLVCYQILQNIIDRNLRSDKLPPVLIKTPHYRQSTH